MVQYSHALMFFRTSRCATPAFPRMTWMVSTVSTSAYHNTVPANSTPKTRQSFARLSFGHHSCYVPMFQHCSPRSFVFLLSILFTDLAFVLLFILRTYAPPLLHPRPHVQYSDRSAIQFRASPYRSIELGFLPVVQRTPAPLLPVPCFKFAGHISFQISTFLWLTLQRT